MDSWNELLKAFELGLIHKDKEPEPIEYRLHYDQNGRITMCSMQNHPENTQYLVVSKQEYENYWMYKIDKGQLVVIQNNIGLHMKPMERKIYEKSSFPKHAAILKEHE